MSPPTPLVPLFGIDPYLYGKIEYLHPSGTMKHRAIPAFLQARMVDGTLSEGSTVAILSAGSAAVTTAWAGTQLGLKVVAVIPTAASPSVVKQLHWWGAQVRQGDPPALGDLMATLADTDGVYVLAQAEEARLVDAYRAVAEEILDQCPEATGILVGLGTGISAMGIARGVADRGGRVAVFGVEPSEAAVASGQPWQPHRVPGLAPPIPRPLLDPSCLREILAIPSAAAWDAAQRVARGDGHAIGPSSGITVAAAEALRRRSWRGPLVAVCACAMGPYLDLYTPGAHR